jgi:hypothetical protein
MVVQKIIVVSRTANRNYRQPKPAEKLKTKRSGLFQKILSQKMDDLYCKTKR